MFFHNINRNFTMGANTSHTVSVAECGVQPCPLVALGGHEVFQALLVCDQSLQLLHLRVVLHQVLHLLLLHRCHLRLGLHSEDQTRTQSVFTYTLIIIINQPKNGVGEWTVITQKQIKLNSVHLASYAAVDMVMTAPIS